MKDTLATIDRFCQQKGVESRDLLGCLLAILQNSHSLTVMQHRGKSRTVLDEIAGHAQLNGRIETPASVMAAVEVIVESQEVCDRANVADARERSAPGLAHIERQLLVEQSLCLILRELMNTAEHDMLEAGMWSDGMVGPDGKFDFDRPKDEPDEPTPPSKSPTE